MAIAQKRDQHPIEQEFLPDHEALEMGLKLEKVFL
jgi:hypothetical protein